MRPPACRSSRLQFSAVRPDPHIRRGRPDRDDHRAASRCLPGVPLLGVLLDPQRSGLCRRRVEACDGGVDALRRFCGWIAMRMMARPGLYTLVSLIVVAVPVARSTPQLEPRYRLADQVPDKRAGGRRPATRLDAKLTGANPIDVLIELPPGVSLYAPETLAVIADVHAAVETAGGRRQCLVAGDAARVAGRESRRSGYRHAAAICRAAAGASARAVSSSAEQDAVVVTGRIPDIDASSCCRSSTNSISSWTPCARSIPATRLRSPACRDRRAQQRGHDRQAEQRADDRDHLRRGLHRPGVPVGAS